MKHAFIVRIVCELEDVDPTDLTEDIEEACAQSVSKRVAVYEVLSCEVIDAIGDRVTEQLSLELLALMDHEKVIEQGFASASDLHWVLDEIRNRELFRAANYPTFEDYYRGRWGVG